MEYKEFRQLITDTFKGFVLNENQSIEKLYEKLSINWISYDWNKIESRPKETGRYEVYRSKCNKQHYETWNGIGWSSNNNDITHYRKIKSPKK